MRPWVQFPMLEKKKGEGNLGTETWRYPERSLSDDGKKDWMDSSSSQGKPRLAGNHQN
jgi:hypothetical protein